MTSLPSKNGIYVKCTENVYCKLTETEILTLELFKTGQSEL